jgi:outer membrane protein assembly factor BamB
VKLRLCTVWALALLLPCAVASPARATVPGPTDWPTYGHDLHRTFHGQTSLTPATIHTLAPAWFFPTGDAVTANPIVVCGTAYFGSWDGFFYAVDAATGAERWHYRLKPQPAVHPAAGPQSQQSGRLAQYVRDLLVDNDPAKLADDVQSDTTSDGGMVTSSAFFYPADQKTQGRDIVIFGGGYTLYALHADDGTEFFPPHDYPGTGCTDEALQPLTPCPAGDPNTDEARIFSSPAVVRNRILFSVDADGQGGHRGYMVSANLENGNPQWIREIDVDAEGNVLNDGCGNVWASPTIIDIRRNADNPSVRTMTVEVVSVSDCDFANPVLHEKTLAVDVESGKIHWIFDPGRDDPNCDWDFGATANYGTVASDGSAFLGVGGKDGTYYRIDPDRGTLVWRRNLVFGGFSGGFIGSTAFDGVRAYGATALGDFGRFEGFGSLGCMPLMANSDGNLDLLIQEPSVHAVDAGSGAVAWQGILSQSFGPTVVAGGMVFVGTGITKQVHIRDAASGQLLSLLQLPASSDSGVIVAGDSIYFGTGSSEQGIPAGVYAFRPLQPSGLLGLLKKLIPALPLP